MTVVAIATSPGPARALAGSSRRIIGPATPPAVARAGCTISAHPRTMGGIERKGESAMPSIARLGHVGLYTNDLDKQRRFYQDVLGLTVTDEDPDVGMVFLSARP